MSETTTEDPAEQPPKKPRRRRLLRALSACAIIPVAVIVFVLGLILDRDMPAPSWVITEIEQRARESLAGGALSVGDVTVTLGRDLHPRVRLRDIAIRDASGAGLARIPLIETQFSPRGLLFEREALVQNLDVTGAQVNLRRAADGSVALSFQSGAAQVEEAQTFLGLLDQVEAVLDLPALVALETINADGLIINYEDARAGRAWTVDGGVMTLDVRDETTRLTGDFAVLSGGAGISTLTMAFESPRHSQVARFEAVITDVSARDIASQSPALRWLAGIDAPVSAQFATESLADGSLGPLSASLNLGAGALQPNPATEPFAFDGAQVDLTYDQARNLIAFDRVEVEGDLGRVNATGQAILAETDSGLPRSLAGQFYLTDAELNPPNMFSEPVSVTDLQVDLKLDLQPFTLRIGHMFARLPGGDLHASGFLAATDSGWGADIAATVPQIAQDDLLALWPEDRFVGPRNWLIEAVSGAAYTDMQFGFRKVPAVPLQMSGSFGFTAEDLVYLRSMPPLQGARGTATLTQKLFALALHEGKVTSPVGGTVDLADSTMIIPDLKVDFRPATYDLHIAGALPDVLALADEPPMRFLSKANLPRDLAEGSAEVRVDLTHPLKRGMTSAEVQFAATAMLRDIDSRQLIPNRRLQANQLTLAIDKEGMQVAGRANVDGAPVNGRYAHRFRGEGGGTLSAIVSMTDTRLRQFGITLPAGSVAGEGDMTLDMTFPRGGAPRYTVTSDLRGLQVAIPAVGWAKPPSIAGRLDLSGRLGSAPRVDDFTLSGGALNLRGDISFAAGGGVDRVRLSRVQIGDWLNAPITLRGRGAGRPMGVEIGGGFIDLRRANFSSGGSGSSGGPIAIALDRLQVTEGIALDRFSGNFTTVGGFAGDFEALINNAGAVSGTVAPRNGRSAVRIRSNDAGAVARAAGLLENAVGGALDLTLLPAGGAGTFDGQLAIRDLRIRDAPAMAALLNAISVVGLLQQLGGQGLVFDDVDARFRLTPEQIILTESSATGPSLGISLDGRYLLAAKSMDLQGVVSPFYLINSIGSVFTRRGEGLIGFNFNIAGTSSDPQVSVNPLSALTPGMFRDIFRRDPPVVNQ